MIPTPNKPQTTYIIGPNGTGIPWKPFQYLYYHIKKTDQKLFDAFDKVSTYLQLLIGVESFPSAAVATTANSATFDLNDLTSGTDIAPVLPVRQSGTIFEVSIICKQTLSSDLVITVNVNSNVICSITYSSSNPAFTTVTASSLSNTSVTVGQYITVDINSSDGSSSYTGVATVIVRWH